MHVALHLDPENPSKLLGVWAAPPPGGNEPRCFYPTDSYGAPSQAQPIGQDVMDSWPSIRPRAGWEKWLRYLAGRTPYVAWWEMTEVDDDTDLEAIFVVASASVLTSAAAIHGATGSGFTAKMMSAEDEFALAADWVGLVAHRYGGPTEPFHSEARLSSRFAFRANGSTLLVGLIKPNAKVADADLALAYGLAHAGDRDLWIVLPEDLAGPTLDRAAFVETKVRIFTVSDDGVSERSIPSTAQVLAGPTDTIVTDTLVLGPRAAWVAPLLAWADCAPAVEAAHRRSYLAWHCAGRLVLRIRRTRAGLKIAAGVQYSKPIGGQPEPTVLVINEPLTAVQAHRVIESAARAAADVLDGTDPGHAEHLLQSLLQPHHLGLRTPMHREFPARRVSGQRAFLDFLGVSPSGDLHIIETKVGGDEMLVLQGLDYWIWARRNLAQLIPFLELRSNPRVTIDFVVASPDDNSNSIGPYTAAQAEALSGEIGWRFHTVTGWQTAQLQVDSSTPPRTAPPNAPRVQPRPRWAVHLGRHLAIEATKSGTKLKAGVFWPHANDGLVPEAVSVLDDLRRQGLDHRMVGHVRSSQAFALNLFAPLTDDALKAVWRRLGCSRVELVERPVFEWSDPDDVLGEATARSRHQTQVDVLLRAVTRDGARVAALIEVKLSETDFNPCSAHDSMLNPYPQVCCTSKPFGGLPELCFQLANKGGEHRRRYETYLDGIADTNSAGVGCPFRYANQPMRNAALARTLVERVEVDHAFVALCAPEPHRMIWRRWSEAQRMLDGIPSVYLTDLPASAVVQYHLDDDADALGARYLLDTQARARLRNRHDAQLKLDALFPNGAAYEHVASNGRVENRLLFSRPVVTDVSGETIEITSPPFSYPLPLTFAVAAELLETAAGTDGAVHLELKGADDSGTTRRLTNDVEATGVDAREVERLRSQVRANYFDFDFAPPIEEGHSE